MTHQPLEWSTSHAIFVPEIDDDHEEIIAALRALEAALVQPDADWKKVARNLIRYSNDHFASEERLMRASRYDSLRWHKSQHDYGRKCLKQLMARVRRRDSAGVTAMIAHLKSWLDGHMRVADMMMGAFLRHQRRIGKIAFLASTRPIEGCQWTDASGEPIIPPTTE